MQVLILGSGVIGTSIAYYLARAGHEVTVLERQPAPALETSFGNAGEVSPGYSAPWAGPATVVRTPHQQTPLYIYPRGFIVEGHNRAASMRPTPYSIDKPIDFFIEESIDNTYIYIYIY